MSYQVLARKYRPRLFAEVIGQDHITTTLGNALSSGRIHHAYLFTGVRGVGKTTVARILARALNCKSPRGFEPCGECGPCREISEGRSLDVQEIDGASNNGVDEVREIRERVKYMPASGKYKIYIIDEVHMLSTPAFNALLKTLEEPPSHAVFMLATTESHKIPATILSRCQRHDFRRIPARLIASTLSRIAADEDVSLEEDALKLIAREATGSMRDAQSLFDQAIAYCGKQVTAESIKGMLGFLDRRLLFGAAEAALDRAPQRALAILEELYSTGADLARLSYDLLEILRHLLVVSECPDEKAGLDLTADEVEALKSMSGKADPTQLHQMFSLWYGVADQISRSPFPRMLMEVGLIRLCRIEPARPIAEIVSRLDALLEGRAPEAARPQAAPHASAPKPRAEALANPAPGNGEAQEAARNEGLAFEPVDADAERRWQEFMRWITGERPQAASILQQGSFEGLSSSDISIRFDKPHFAEMLLEDDRKRAVEELIESFFKRPLKLAVSLEKRADAPPPASAPGGTRSEMVKEALSSEIVKQAADILGAKLHDVKTNAK